MGSGAEQSSDEDLMIGILRGAELYRTVGVGVLQATITAIGVIRCYFRCTRSALAKGTMSIAPMCRCPPISVLSSIIKSSILT